MEPKKDQSKEIKLKVMEALQEEVYKGIVRIDAQTMREVGARVGDIIEIEGGRVTVGIADRAYPADIGQNLIRMDGLLRRNAKTSIGDFVKVRRADIKEAKQVTIAPAQQGIMVQADPELFRNGLLGRAVIKGDQISLGGTGRRKTTMMGSPFEDIFDVFEQGFGGNFGFGGLKFIVVNTNPKQAVIITEETELIVSPHAVEVSEERVIDVTYEDVGGLEDEVKKLREMVELPLKHPELFIKLGIEPPKGVLLHGPPGTGKTLLAKAVANESEANFISINGPEIVSKFVGEAEKRIRKLFDDAEKNAPSIIFIDEIDAIAPKREETYGEVERRIVAQLLATMDGLKGRGKVIVIGATNRPNSIDPALRRPGRFDREIEIGVPDKKGRLNVLKIHTRHMPLTKDVNLQNLANITHGFVGADLEALCKEAAMNVLRRILPDIEFKEDKPLSQDILEKLNVNGNDFKEALKLVRPSAMREVLIETPTTTWDDIGGLEDLKQELKEAVEWPLKYPNSFKNLGIRPPRGILLYGPPGTGKTLLAKAVANESEANFISVKGPELLSMWVGESLPYDEEIIVKYNGIVKRMKIGDIVEKKLNVQVLAFNKDKRIRFCNINDHIKHKLSGKLLEITTRTGRKIRVTDYHSLFSFVAGKLADVPASHLIAGESYIAIPRNLNLPREIIKEINLYNYFKNNEDIFAGNVKNYLKSAKKILGLKNASNLLRVSKKYFGEIISGNLPVSINNFDKLITESGLAIDYNKLKIKLKGSIHNYPAILKIDSDFWGLVGIWIAEGDFNGYTIRIHNQNPEIRKKIREVCTKYNFSYSDMKTCVTINSQFLQKLFINVLGLEKGAENKKVPELAFILDKESKSSLLRGYFSGDGSIYEGERGKFNIEAGTISKRLANDLLYLLLDFGILSSCYTKTERTGSTTFRISILGVKNFEKFLDIGFIDKKRNERITQYIKSRKWSRSDLIPLSGDLFELASNCNKVYTTNTSIGKDKLRQMLIMVDKDKMKFKDYWDLVDGDIYFDLVKEIRVIKDEEYVYDVSVPGEQNFVGGFGGVIAHNSERGVRKIFERARQVSPCIIFFDEIDSLASRRGRSVGNDATDKVVNQFLTEIDGLEELNDVVVIGATNRPDLVDSALLRPGRFDRALMVSPPDKKGRLNILKIHTEGKKMPLKDVKLETLAEKTANFTGADIEALCREAAILALRENIKAEEVTMKHFNRALERVSSSISEEEVKRYKLIEENYLKSARGAAIKNQNGNYFG